MTDARTERDHITDTHACTRVSMARRAALAKEVELEWAKEMEREGEKEMEQGSWKAAVTPRAAVDSAGSSAGQESAVSMRAAVDSASSSAGQDSSLAVASRDASTDKSGVAGYIKVWVVSQRWLRGGQARVERRGTSDTRS